MAKLVDIHMPTDLTEWTSVVNGSGSSFAYTSAGLAGTTGGGLLTIGGTASTYARKTHTAVGTSVYWLRLYVGDLNGLTMASGNEFVIAEIWRAASGSRKSRIRYKNNAGTRTIIHDIRNDAGSTTEGGEVALGATTYITLRITKATNGTGANDGTQSLFFDGVQQTSANVTGIDIFDHFNYDEIRVGAAAELDAGTSGTAKFDEVVVDDADDPGAANNAPVLTVPGAQTCTLGTQKSVTGVSVADADGPTGLTIRCQVNGSATCTVTLSGSVTITAGTNGTNDFTIGTGATVAELNTVLDGIKTDLAQVAWTDTGSAPPAGHITASTTITLTASDGIASDVETITCNWTLATGDGTKSLLLDHATIAGINAEIAASLYLPVPGLTYTDYLYILVTDGNANTAEALVVVEVEEVVGAATHVPTGGGGGSVEHRSSYVQIG